MKSSRIALLTILLVAMTAGATHAAPAANSANGQNKTSSYRIFQGTLSSPITNNQIIVNDVPFSLKLGANAVPHFITPGDHVLLRLDESNMVTAILLTELHNRPQQKPAVPANMDICYIILDDDDEPKKIAQTGAWISADNGPLTSIIDPERFEDLAAAVLAGECESIVLHDAPVLKVSDFYDDTGEPRFVCVIHRGDSLTVTADPPEGGGTRNVFQGIIVAKGDVIFDFDARVSVKGTVFAGGMIEVDDISGFEPNDCAIFLIKNVPVLARTRLYDFLKLSLFHEAGAGSYDIKRLLGCLKFDLANSVIEIENFDDFTVAMIESRRVIK